MDLEAALGEDFPPVIVGLQQWGGKNAGWRKFGEVFRVRVIDWGNTQLFCSTLLPLKNVAEPVLRFRDTKSRVLGNSWGIEINIGEDGSLILKKLVYSPDRAGRFLLFEVDKGEREAILERLDSFLDQEGLWLRLEKKMEKVNSWRMVGTENSLGGTLRKAFGKKQFG